MKLVEILARELKEWPFAEHLPMTQAYDGSIFVSSADRGEGEGTLRTGITVTIAEDIASDEPVTRAQWEAERARIAQEEDDRMLAKHKAGADELERRHAETEREAEDWHNECQKQYEQELWDRVAVMILEKVTDRADTIYGAATCAADQADAFMAERAKRMNQ